jgi:PKD repeat protein
VTTTLAPLNASLAIIEGAQVNTTLTAVPITCTGGSCTSGNTTSSNPGAPVSSFSANPIEAYVPPDVPNPNLSVQFTDTSTNAPTSWHWTFGDGNSSTAQNPIFTYYGYNYYQVILHVNNNDGESQSTATIGVCPLVASFTVSPANGQVPLTVEFTDTSTDQPISWFWNFGDGTSSNLQDPTHTYITSGVYTVRLDATNNLGRCWYTSTITVSPLVASFTAIPTTGLASPDKPLTVQFTDTTKFAGPNQPGYPQWYWDFGDGYNSTQQNPSHMYTVARPEGYDVTLAANNGYGWSTPQITHITVYSLPTANWSSSALIQGQNAVVQFTDSSTSCPSPASWYWDFGDGYNSTQQNPSHMYTNYQMQQSYYVAHSATNSQGTKWQNRTISIS